MGRPRVRLQHLWTEAFAGFTATATAADDPMPVTDNAIGFAPELLPAEFGYALLIPDVDGEAREASDRWDQAQALTALAADCFRAAAERPSRHPMSQR